MSRAKRIYSDQGIYHIMFRGVNKQNIFEEEFDYKVMSDYILNLKKKFSFEIYAYCFMTNHVHLVMKEKNMGDISLIMKNLLTKYALYFNNKYDRRGHLYESRYKSKPISNEDYLYASICYVHQNPVKAYVVEKMEDYNWSSYKEYINNLKGLSDKDYILSLVTLSQLESMHGIEPDEYDPFDEKQQTLRELRKFIVNSYGMEPEAIAELSYIQRRAIIIELRRHYSLALISAITNINPRTLSGYK